MIHPGMALRAIRVSQGKTLEDLAAALDSDTGNLSKKERGIDDIPVRFFVEWCIRLDVLPSDVYLIAEQRSAGMTSDLARIAKLMSKLNASERNTLVDQAEFYASRK